MLLAFQSPVMPRGPKSATELSELAVGLLSRVSSGSLEIDVDSSPFASVDAQSRSIDVQIAPLLRPRRRASSLLREEGPFAVWKARKIPAEMARAGWRLTLRDGSHELLALGRGTSALTGHVHVNPAALWQLRKLV
jgi:hypothetical protein